MISIYPWSNNDLASNLYCQGLAILLSLMTYSYDELAAKVEETLYSYTLPRQLVAAVLKGLWIGFEQGSTRDPGTRHCSISTMVSQCSTPFPSVGAQQSSVHWMILSVSKPWLEMDFGPYLCHP